MVQSTEQWGGRTPKAGGRELDGRTWDDMLAERGYDHDKYRRLLWARGIRPVIAERGRPTTPGWASSGTSSRERSPGCTASAGLRIHWERRDDIHEAFLGLATCLITYRHMQRLC